VVLAVAGKTGSAAPIPVVNASPALLIAEASSLASPAAATASPRSDWPAAIRPRRTAEPRRREEGTDGLMGRLAFGLPGDTPYPPTMPPERKDRFELDVVPTSPHFDPAPLRGRRLGVLGWRTDPMER